MFNYLLALYISIYYLSYIYGLWTHVNVSGSAVISIDKLVKGIIIYVGIPVMLYELKHEGFRRIDLRYTIPIIIYCTIYIVHFLIALPSAPDYFIAEKEVVRLVAYALVFVFLMLSVSRIRSSEHVVFVIYVLGLILAILSIRHSLYGETDKFWTLVHGYVRAGEDIVGANRLAALLNISFFTGLYFAVNSSNKVKAIFHIGMIIVIQVARFFTFSTGALLSLGVSFLFLFFFLSRHSRVAFKRLAFLSLAIVFIFTVALLATGSADLFFARLNFQDKIIYKSSVSSRLDQYIDYLHLLGRYPLGILTGFGTANLSGLLAHKLDIHNSFIRPLANGGIVAFLAFCSLCWVTLKGMYKASIHNIKNQYFAPAYVLSAYIGWLLQSMTLPGDSWETFWLFFSMGYILVNADPPTQHKVKVAQ